jgi:hypothetical protein
MLRLLTRGLLLSALGLGVVAVKAQPVYAEEEEEEDDGGGGDDEGGGGGEDEGESEDEEDDKDQPAVTAGGLFTLKSYPIREIDRPLTMTEGIAQIRVGTGTDLSAKGAFESFGLNAEAIYGYRDNFSIIGGVTDAYNFKQYGFYAGFEAALVYDLLDVRVAANFHRFAIPRYEMFTDNMGAVQFLPNGQFDASKPQFSLDLGFPFRYAIKPEIAIIALHTLVSIDFNSATRGDPDNRMLSDGTTNAAQPESCLAIGNGTDLATLPDPANCIENGAKPDLNPSIGIATNPIAALSVVVFAQLRIPDFDTSAGLFKVPVTGRVQFSPSHKLDIGLEFTLLNVKPPEGQSPIDNRFLALFMQSRFGK